MPSDSLEQLRCQWKKPSPENQKGVCKGANDIGNEFPCGKVYARVKKELSFNISPHAVFDNILICTSYITDVVIPQTVLYSQQNSNVFATNGIELKAFFTMHLVMGYHALPSLRD